MDVTKCLHISLCLTVFLDVAVSAYSQSRLNNLRDDDLVTAAPSLSIATLRDDDLVTARRRCPSLH